MVTKTTEKVTTSTRGKSTKVAGTRGNHVTGNRPPERIPLSGSRTRLSLDESKLDPAFHYKWINDDGDKIQRFMNAYYELVSAEEGIEIGQRSIDTSTGELASVVSRDVGGGKTAFLMKQPIEFYNEDKAAKEEAVNRREDAMKQSLNSGQDGTYGEVKFSQ